MPIFLLIIGVVALLLFAKKKQAEAEAQSIADSAQKNDPFVTPVITNFQAKQIDTFSKIASLAAAPSAVVASAAASSGLVLGLSATAWTGIGAAVAAVIIGIGLLRGTAHVVARQWTDNVQDPFHRALAAIVDAKDASIADGSASSRSVTLAKQATVILWGRYRDGAEEFAANGPDYRLVINQSYATLNPILAQITSDMDAQIARIP